VRPTPMQLTLYTLRDPWFTATETYMLFYRLTDQAGVMLRIE